MSDLVMWDNYEWIYDKAKQRYHKKVPFFKWKRQVNNMPA